MPSSDGHRYGASGVATAPLPSTPAVTAGDADCADALGAIEQHAVVVNDGDDGHAVDVLQSQAVDDCRDLRGDVRRSLSVG